MWKSTERSSNITHTTDLVEQEGSAPEYVLVPLSDRVEGSWEEGSHDRKDQQAAASDGRVTGRPNHQDTQVG